MGRMSSTEVKDLTVGIASVNQKRLKSFKLFKPPIESAVRSKRFLIFLKDKCDGFRLTTWLLSDSLSDRLARGEIPWSSER